MKPQKVHQIFLLLAGLLLLLSQQPARAQETAHKHALQWVVAPRKSFYGYSSFSYEYLLANNRRIRIGLELVGQASSFDQFIKQEQGRYTYYSNISDWSQGDNQFGVSLIHLKGFPVNRRITMLFGTGLIYATGSYKINQFHSGSRSTDADGHSWSFGLLGKVGGEYLIDDRISIVAEYGWFFRYMETITDYTSRDYYEVGNRVVTTSLRLEDLIAKVGLRYAF